MWHTNTNHKWRNKKRNKRKNCTFRSRCNGIHSKKRDRERKKLEKILWERISTVYSRHVEYLGEILNNIKRRVRINLESDMIYTLYTEIGVYVKLSAIAWRNRHREKKSHKDDILRRKCDVCDIRGWCAIAHWRPLVR